MHNRILVAVDTTSDAANRLALERSEQIGKSNARVLHVRRGRILPEGVAGVWSVEHDVLLIRRFGLTAVCSMARVA
jgi:hypothetical protein